MNNEEFQVLIGSLLGDGSVYIPKGRKNAIYQEKKKVPDAEYLWWKSNILQRFNPSISLSSTNDYDYTILITRSHPELTKLRQSWYPSGKKGIVIEDMEKLDALGLAVFYQDDGHLQVSNYCCEIYGEFPPKENENLKRILKEKWGISCKLRLKSSYTVISFNTKESKKLLQTISPFIHPCMRRKTIEGVQEKHRIFLDELARKSREKYHGNLEYRLKKLGHNSKYRKKHRVEVLRRKRDYYWINKDKIALKRHKFYQRNRDRILQDRRDSWRKSGRRKWQEKYYGDPKYRTKHLQRIKIYREKNKDKIQTQRQRYYLENRDWILQRGRAGEAK